MKISDIGLSDRTVYVLQKAEEVLFPSMTGCRKCFFVIEQCDS
jgi:hypothetical protein